jgi:hypothetical protein
VEGKKQAGQAALDWGRAGGRAPPQQAGRLTQNASLVQIVPNKPYHLFVFNLINGKEIDGQEPNG